MSTPSSQTSHNVVICVDPSEHSEAAFKYFCNSFARKEHTIHLLHVMEWWGGGVWNMSPARLDDCIKESKKTADDLQAKYTQLLAQFGVNGVFHKLEEKHSNMWHDIIDFANSVNAQLIIMGSRGLNKLRKTLIGSTSDSVLHHSNIPVLVYKH